LKRLVMSVVELEVIGMMTAWVNHAGNAKAQAM
jgi:hypothetical protein